MQIASLSVHPWKFIGRKSKVQLSIIVCFTGTALQVSSSATPWLIAKFTMMKVCLCTSRPAILWVEAEFDGESCEKKGTRDVEECQPMLPLAHKTSRQKALTVERSLQQVKACTQSVFVSASHLHIKTPGVLVLSLLLLLPLWSTSPSFSPPWLFS